MSTMTLNKRASENVMTFRHLVNGFEKIGTKQGKKEKEKFYAKNCAYCALLRCGPSLNCNSRCTRGQTIMD